MPAIKRGCNKHSHAHNPGIRHLQTNFRGVHGWIEHGQNVIDPSFDNLIRISIQMDIRKLTHTHRVQIVFVNVANDPDISKIGNGHRIRRAQPLHACRIRNLLDGDDAGDRSVNVDDAGGMILIDSQNMQLLASRLQVGLSVLGHVFGLFQSTLGDRSFVIENSLPFQIQSRQKFVIHRLAIGLIGARDIVTLHLHEQLTLLHQVAEPRFHLDHPPCRERDHRHRARNIRLHQSGHVQSRCGLIFDGGCKSK